MPKLLLKFNAAVIKEIPFKKEALSVGRKPDNDIVIDNPAVSGHHCRIALKGDTYFVEDLDSTNGTFVNEKRVVKSGLHHNDIVGVAKHSLVFLEDAAQQGKDSAPGDSEPDGTAQPGPEDAARTTRGSTEGGAASKQFGVLKVLDGIVGEGSYELRGLSTYIGKSDRVAVPIKGSGLFGSAPEVAASIHRKPEGYVLVAVKDGYPEVDGVSVSGQAPLKDGSIIKCGATTFQFFLKDEEE